MIVKRLLFLSKLSLLLLYASAYSGESEYADDSESELSGDSRSIDTCKPINQNGENIMFGDQCTLEAAFRKHVGQMDLTSSRFLTPMNFLCQSFLNEGVSKKFECLAKSFMILPLEQGDMRLKNVELTLRVKDKSYKSMEIKMKGSNESQVFKNADSYDIQVNLSLSNLPDKFEVKDFLEQHFKVKYADLKTNYTNLDKLFPTVINKFKLSALFNPLQYVEVILWPDDTSFFIIQKLGNSAKHSAGYFKEITTDSDKESVQFKQNFQNKINEEFLTSSPECFSSCTSDIPMIMNSKYRNLTRKFTTKMNTVLMPKGATLRWRQNEIGYSALFSQKEGMLTTKVYSYDSISGLFSDVIKSFFTPSITFNDKLYASVLQKRVAFKELVFDVNSVSLNCEVDEDWDIANNLVNLRGMNLRVELKENNWEVSGNGDALVLGKMVAVKIEIKNKSFNLVGDFNVNNMSSLTSAAGNVLFLPEDKNHKSFDYLKFLPLSYLKLSTALDSPDLKFEGVSLSYANTENKGVPSNTSLQIIVYSRKNYRNNLSELKMVVEICQNDVLFEKFFKEVLDVTLEGVPWLVFEKFCFFVAKDNKDIEKYFKKEPSKMLAKPGIHYSGKILFKKSMCNKEVTNTEDICNFIQKNYEMFLTFEEGNGFINQNSFEFKARISGNNLHPLKDNLNLVVKKPCLHLKEIFQKNNKTIKISEDRKVFSEPKNYHNNHKNHHKKQEVHSIEQANIAESPDTLRMVGLSVKGNFEYHDLATYFTTKGMISSYDSGQLTLHCESAKIKLAMNKIFKLENISDVEFEANQGKSFAKNNTFFIFDFASKVKILFNNRASNFDKGRLTFNLANANETYFTTVMDFSYSSILEMLSITNFKENFVFAGVKFQKSALLVWSAQDSVIVEAGSRTARGSVLTLFGSANRSSSALDFKMEIKKNFLRYEEWLPILNVANGKFKLFHKKDISKGPKLKLNWEFHKGKFKPILSGTLKVVGLSEEISLPLKDNGSFELKINKSFFNQVEGYFFLQQKYSLTSFKDINPLFQVDLVHGSEEKMKYISNKVEMHIKSLAEQFASAFEGTFFYKEKKSAEDLLYLPAEKIANTLKQVNQMINNLILKISEIRTVANKDCVEECKQSIVKIPGIVVQSNTKNKVFFDMDPEEKEAVNVTCIADCEIRKSVESENYEFEVNEIKKHLEVFDELHSKVQEIHTIYTEYEKATIAHSNIFNVEKKTEDYENLEKFVAKFKASGFFSIRYLGISANLAEIVIRSDNCVENFQASYTMFNEPVRSFRLCQCFNGEYAIYFAKKVTENYFGDQLVKLDEFYKFHSTYVAKQEESLNALETSLKNIYKEYESASIQSTDQFSDQRFVVEHKDSQHHSLAKDSTDYLNRQTLTFYTRSLDLPQIIPRNRALLEENQVTITRSVKTKKAFLYSSPWAALSAFDPKDSLKEDEVVVQALPSNESHCNVVAEAGNQYVELYKSIRSISDSYSRAVDQLNVISQSMQKETNTLKERNVGTSNETTNDQLYWVRQLERGSQFFSELIKKKLSKYSATALTSFKSKFERALKRNGVRNINRFVRQLKKQFQWARTSSSTKKIKGLKAASKLSDAIVNLFSNPKLKLDEITNRINKMGVYVTNIYGIVHTCIS